MKQINSSRAVFSGLASLWCVAALSASAAEIPPIDSPVTDLAHVLSPEKLQALDEQLRAHQKASGVQLAVLLIDTTDGEAIESYSLRAATAWGGGDKRRDDGGLFVLALKDRRMRIELGYGLEGRVTDIQAEQLLEGAKDGLRSGDTDAAVQSVMDGLMQLTVEGTMSAEERARLDQIEADAAPIHPKLLSLYSYLIVFLVFGIIGRVAKSRLDADEPASKAQVAIVLTLLIVAVEVGCGVAGLGWANGWAALCGSLAGVTFLFSDGQVTLMYPVFLLISAAVAAAFLDDPNVSLFVRGLLQLAITIFLGGFVKNGNITLFGSSSTSFDSDGATSRSSRSSRHDDWDTVPSWMKSSGSSSKSSSSWGSSSSSSKSSGGYGGGGGSFGGGGASSSW